EETTRLFAELFARPDADVLLKRDIIIAMAKRKARYWLSPLAKEYVRLTPWERRALLPASFVLGDEGQHWRKKVKPQLNTVDKAYLEWVSQKNNGRVWDIPL